MTGLPAMTLPKEITSYDILKTLAVALMIVDHVGYYFFPEQEWFRVFGRLCVPMWFFLIGYARSRDIGPRLWIGGLVLVAANVAVGMTVFMLNILITIILVRLVLDPVMKFALKSNVKFWLAAFVILVLALPTWLVTEYGAIGLLLAMFGYLVRHKREGVTEDKKRIDTFMAFTGLAFIAFNIVLLLMPDITPIQIGVLAAGTFAVMIWLTYFKPETYPDLTAKMPSLVVGLLHIGGRRTLEIYVIHLLLFKFAALFLFPDKYGLFEWSLVR